MSREARSRAAKPRETERRQPLPEDAFSPRWKCVRLHGSECSAETGADERPLIAVSAGNFNIANPKGITNKIGCVLENG